MADDTGRQPTRPWWVRLAIPAASAKRRDVLRNTIVMCVLGGLWGAAMIGGAFMEASSLYPYRWWVLGFFVVVGVAMLAEIQAIRWTDRAGIWQR